MGVEDLKKLMTDIKSYSEKDPDVSTEMILTFIEDRLAGQFNHLKEEQPK